jgi:hypothetical protein
MHTRCDGQGNVREHILGLVDLRDKFTVLKCPLNDEILLHHVTLSLPSVFDPFKINYNGSDTQWDIRTLIGKCNQEEERLRSQNHDFANHVRQEVHKGRNKRVIYSKKSSTPGEPQQNGVAD